ncbi:MAG: sulfatase-like hydrolase/transferase [Bacteroidota bacterium]|nr:sulfatase-like hydrolase/transferase [Bacteroidota bacterium]
MKYTKNLLLFLVLVLISQAGTSQTNQANQESPKPNIIIILADDMGYGDLGCTGSVRIKTPNLDNLAANGTLCHSAYVTASVCAPSRAGLLTGRIPHRFGFENNLPAWNKNTPTRERYHGLHPDELTIADHLKNAGYETAIIGKWHLGAAEVHHPNNRGFDYFCGMIGGGHNYFPEKGRSTIQRNGTFLKSFSSPYLTDFFTDEGVNWIVEHNNEDNRDKPWFLFMSYNAPHTPMQAKEKDLAECSHIQDPGRRTYAAMVQALDRGVGRLIQQLKDEGIYENTLIVFFSDNGGATNNHSWRGPFSGSKGNMREGGIRVPMIWHWPSEIPKGTSNAVISSLDLLPSFLAAANAEPIEVFDKTGRKQEPRTYDGINLIPVLKGETEPEERRLFWRLQGQSCVLDGADKFIRLTHRPAQYFRPFEDLGERNDLSQKYNERYLELYDLLFKWESSLPTYPHNLTAPYWIKASAENYEDFVPVPEQK